MRVQHQLVIFSALALLVACGQSQPQLEVQELDSSSANAYAEQRAYPWTYSREDKVSTLGATADDISYGPLGLVVSAKNAWGPIEINQSNGERGNKDGKTLTINGKTYTAGYGVHAGSEMQFNLKEVAPFCSQFISDIGIDDEVGQRGSVIFQVYLDGKVAYDSGVVTGKDSAKSIEVDIKGKQEMRLVVSDSGNGINNDHANWANPKFTCQSVFSNPNVSVDKNSMAIYHLHSDLLRMTFNNHSAGKVDLRLEAEPKMNEFGQIMQPYPLVLDTPSIELSGQSSETHAIAISAPKALKMMSYNSSSYLIVSKNNQDIGKTPLTLTEIPIKFSARFEPSVLSGRVGEVKTVKVIVTADPPLEEALPLAVGYAGPDQDQLFEFTSVGSVRGNGATMEQDIQIRFLEPWDPMPTPNTRTLHIGMAVGDITTGYRHHFYGNAPYGDLDLTILP